jgi:hypothetical protein
MTRRLLVRLRARLDASPIRRTDQLWLDLDSEVMRLMVGTAPTVRAIQVVHVGTA